MGLGTWQSLWIIFIYSPARPNRFSYRVKRIWDTFHMKVPLTNDVLLFNSEICILNSLETFCWWNSAPLHDCDRILTRLHTYACYRWTRFFGPQKLTFFLSSFLTPASAAEVIETVLSVCLCVCVSVCERSHGWEWRHDAMLWDWFGTREVQQHFSVFFNVLSLNIKLN